MKSGDPSPSDELKLIMDAKRSAPSQTVDIVSDAARWLKAALKGADVAYTYSSCEDHNHYGYAAFTAIRAYQGAPVSLEMKVAEIRNTPYVFAEVRAMGRFDGTLFPFFGNLRSDDDRDLLLHYIADFVMSSE